MATNPNDGMDDAQADTTNPSVPSLTHRHIYDVYASLRRSKEDNVHNVASVLCAQFTIIREGGAAAITIYQKAKAVYDKITKLNSNRQHKKKEEYLNSAFMPPVKLTNDERQLHSVTTTKERQLAEKLKTTTKKNKQLKRSVAEITEDQQALSTQVEYFQDEYNRCVTEMDVINQEVATLKTTDEASLKNLQN